MVEARSFITTPSHATCVRSTLMLSSRLLIRYSLQTQRQLWSQNKEEQIRFPSIVLLDCPLFSYVSFRSLNLWFVGKEYISTAVLILLYSSTLFMSIALNTDCHIACICKTFTLEVLTVLAISKTLLCKLVFKLLTRFFRHMIITFLYWKRWLECLHHWMFWLRTGLCIWWSRKSGVPCCLDPSITISVV